MEKINCLKCKHYQNTWDPLRPRGCKIYGFKSMTMPQYLVKAETGQECLAFEKQKHFEKKKDKLDLNRDELW